jgi:cell pole-organizing protein PopZ
MKNEPPSPTTPAPRADSADPSMEEILASIRRILNDDEVVAPPSPDSAAAAGEAPDADDDVLILDQSMMVSTSEPASDSAAPEPASDIVNSEPAAHAGVLEPVAFPSESGPTERPREAVVSIRHIDPEEALTPISDLVAPEAAAAAASSVGSLVRTLAAGRATQVFSGGPTLEDMVRAELRPLLKEWLDVNLPPMVERLVRVEIERVVGRCVP